MKRTTCSPSHIRALALAVIAAVSICTAPLLAPSASAADTTVIVGSARINEKGTTTGGSAGDQTGNEVSTQTYYNHEKGWDVLRPTSQTVATRLAEAMRQACANNRIGYCQTHRDSLMTQYLKYGSIAAVATNCEADCSSLVRVCLRQAGMIVGDFTTSNEKTVLLNTGSFRQVTDGSLRPGDVLVTKTQGHTVIVVSGSKSPTSASSSTSTVYYPRYTGSSGSLVDGLKAIGVDSSYANRQAIAKLNGISNYSGTAAQNSQLLSLLKAGKLVKSTSSSVAYFPRYTGSSGSLVDGLKAIGVDSSYSYRTKIATRNGISSYSGTATQNNQLLSLLKAGKLIKP